MSKRHTIELKFNAAQIKDIHEKYSFQRADQPENTTSIDLETVDTLVFLDDTRKPHKCILSQIDFSKADIYKCFWCRHPCTDTPPMGCPVKYVPSVVHRNYFSEINKEKFVVKESISKEINSLTSAIEDLSMEKNDFYESDGIFCSFACMISFVRENKKNPLYAESELLIHKLAGRKIEPAPHWRLLKEYGGTLSLKEFREACNSLEFALNGNYKPFFKSIATAFECKIKF